MSFLDLSLDMCIKIFNTISHIIYSEESQEDGFSLRQNIIDLTHYNRDLYDSILQRHIEDDEYHDVFYKILVASFQKDKESQNMISKGTGIFITFIKGLDNVQYHYKKPIFSNDIGEIHLLVPYRLNEDNTSAKDKIEIVEKMFKIILFYFTDGYTVKTIFSPKTPSYMIGIIIYKLAKLFANLIIDDQELELEEQLKIKYIIDNYGSNSLNTNYIKLAYSKELQNYLFDELYRV